ncbi:thiamine pyrophosphate-requiring protein [Paenibacillus piri]|uniref:Thiamine pyrophosphate-requiring protein n=2 Tax=Paenibacillus piri TaxID=2547395 RepID=A0A4R5KDM4_9BACL|nr:thiamine pyrophosphate-requiring protein [Paenibacillus piri]
MLNALQDWGVSYLFCNLGSDHPALIESFAKAKAQNRQIPEVIMCPHEFAALSAAHGHALLSGRAQGVIVHTDVGTQNMGGSLHNIQRSRVPAFIFAGETPFTLEGELQGGRNSHINHLQNVYDQRGIVRSYVKWDYEIRTGKNVKQLVNRGMQLAHSEPMGPVYLTGAREILEEEVSPSENVSAEWKPVEKIPLPLLAVEQIVSALIQARNPLIITSYLGRNTDAVPQLVQFCEKLAVPVIEQHATHMNFPGDHPFHLGYQGGTLLSEADAILVMDCDVPWVSSISKPSDACKVFYIDSDPLKEEIPLWYLQNTTFYRADCGEALKLLNEYVRRIDLQTERFTERRHRFTELHKRQRHEWKLREKAPSGDTITSEWLTACLRNVTDDETIFMNETITNAGVVSQHLPRNKPATMFVNGGTSLGWSGSAAFGAKLARPETTVVNLTGDGSYLFGEPSAVYWMTRRYQAPLLTVIYNNRGWNATKMNLLKLYPDGIAKRDDRYWVNFDQPADLAKIAEASGGAYARTIKRPDELQEALQAGMEAVKKGQSAVIDVHLPTISQQID